MSKKMTDWRGGSDGWKWQSFSGVGDLNLEREMRKEYHEFSFLNVEIQLIRDPGLTIFQTGMEMGRGQG